MENELKTAQLVQENLFPEPEKMYVVLSHRLLQTCFKCGGDWWFHSEDKHYCEYHHSGCH